MTAAGAGTLGFTRFVLAGFMSAGHCTLGRLAGRPRKAARAGRVGAYLGPMKVGVVLDGRRSASEIAELARLAEAHGFSHVWLSGGARTKDHFVRLALGPPRTARAGWAPVGRAPSRRRPLTPALPLRRLT